MLGIGARAGGSSDGGAGRCAARLSALDAVVVPAAAPGSAGAARGDAADVPSDPARRGRSERGRARLPPTGWAVTGFAELPGRIAALTREHERVAVVLLDAFGWAFVQRHADHPLLRRLEIEPVASQFPSTTTAHLTTLYTGLPVERARALRVADLRAGARRDRPAAAVRRARDGDRWRSTRARSCPGPTFFEQLDVPVARAAAAGDLAVDLQLAPRSPGADVVPYATLRGRGGAARHPRRASRTSTGTRSTPPAIATARRAPSSTRPSSPRSTRWTASATRSLVVTADHGQIDVGATSTTSTRSGRRCSSTCAADRPARRATASCTSTTRRRSSRELADALGERAEVRLAAELFPDAGPRLRARLADVCVLPAPGPDGVAARLSRAASCASRATTAGSRPRRRETWVGHDARMDTGVSYTALDPDTEERFVLAAPRARASRPSASTRSCSAPASAGRIHRHTTQEEVYLVLAGTLHARRSRTRCGSSARASSPASRPTCAATSPTAHDEDVRADRARRRARARRPRRRGVRRAGRTGADRPPQEVPLPGRRAGQTRLERSTRPAVRRVPSAWRRRAARRGG